MMNRSELVWDKDISIWGRVVPWKLLVSCVIVLRQIQDKGIYYYLRLQVTTLNRKRCSKFSCSS